MSNCQSSDHLAELSLGLESDLAYYYVNPAKLPYIPITAVQLEPAPITDLLPVQYIISSVS